MHSNAMPSQLNDQADDNGEAIEGQADGIPEATVARLPVYLRILYELLQQRVIGFR